MCLHISITVDNPLDRFRQRKKPNEQNRQSQNHEEVQLRNTTPWRTYYPQSPIITPTLTDPSHDNEDPPPYDQVQTRTPETLFHLCEHKAFTIPQLHDLFDKYGRFLCRCSRHSFVKEGVFPPYMEVELRSRRIIATSLFYLLHVTPDIQPSIQDAHHALIALDRVVCTHLRTSDIEVMLSLTRRLDLRSRYRQDEKVGTARTRSADLLRKEKGHCDTVFRLNWSASNRAIRLWVTRGVGKMPSLSDQE